MIYTKSLLAKLNHTINRDYAMNSEKPAQNDRRIHGLDGLRGLAALTVVLSHMSNKGLYLFPGLDLSNTGKSGVWLFFVLSSFLLLSQILSWDTTRLRDGRAWADYLVGRVFRIWPLFITVCLVCWITTKLRWPFPVTMNTRELLKTLLLQQGDSILWTIPVEFKFYFMLPLIALTIVFVLKSRFWLSFVVLGSAVVLSFVLIPPVSEGISTIRFLGTFLTGCLLAILYQRMVTDWRTYKQKLMLEIMAWSMILFFILLIPRVASVLTNGVIGIDEIHLAQWLFSILYSLLILGMIFGTGLMRRLLDSTALVTLGAISYSLYLWHLLALKIGLFLGMTSIWGAWLVLFFALLVAWVSYHLLEVPALNYGSVLRRKIRNIPDKIGVPHISTVGK